MRKTFLIAIFAAAALALAALAQAAAVPKIALCHKYDRPAQQTLYLPYQGAMGHIDGHGDWLGKCPVADSHIDVDGIATPMSGLPMGVNVKPGDPLNAWAPCPTGGNEGTDWCDNDGSCTWTMGDDLHPEDPNGDCTTAFRDAFSISAATARRSTWTAASSTASRWTSTSKATSASSAAPAPIR